MTPEVMPNLSATEYSVVGSEAVPNEYFPGSASTVPVSLQPIIGPSSVAVQGEGEQFQPLISSPQNINAEATSGHAFPPTEGESPWAQIGHLQGHAELSDAEPLSITEACLLRCFIDEISPWVRDRCLCFQHTNLSPQVRHLR